MEQEVAIVVSANFRKAYPVVRSLSNIGFRVIGAFYSWRSNVFSRFVHKRFKITNPYINQYKYILDLVRLVKLMDPKVIVPIGFIDNVVISKYRNIFPKNLTIPIPPYKTLAKVSNKLELPNLCKTLNIRCPKTLKFNLKNENKTRGTLYPYVIKGVYDSSKPTYVFTSLSKEIMFSERHALIQEFIPGFGVGYFVLAANGEPILEFCHRRVVEVRPSGGASVVACRYFDPRAYVYGRRIVKFLKWTGILMVEFRKHLETGELYLMEINPKFWGSLELPVSLGYDFPATLVKYMLYGEKPKVRVRDRPKCFSWVLSGIHYLKENPKIWFKILEYSIKDFPWSADVHLDDPPELLFSAITRFINNAVLGKRNLPKLYLRNCEVFFENIKRKGNVEALVFDLDGTLVKLNIKWDEVRRELLRKGFIRSWESITEALYRLFYNDRKMFESISKFIERYEMESIKNIRPNSFLKRTFRVISKKIKLALVTKQTFTLASEVLKRLGVLEYFNTIVGREGEFERKRQILRALELLKVSSPENVFFIGDTLVDAYSAVKAGVTPIIVTDNPYRYFQMLEYGVPVFTNINEPLKIIVKKVMRNEGGSNT